MAAAPGDNGSPSILAALRLNGERFDAPGTPAIALSEIVAFQALLTEVAKARFRQNNGRRRVPAGYDELLDLRLLTIEGGSSTPVLTRPPAPQEDDLFSRIDVGDDFLAEARRDIESFIDAAEHGTAWPDIFQNLPAPVVKRLGQTLRDGESLQLGATPEAARSNTAPRYTRQTRRSVLLSLSGTYTDIATFEGVVVNLGLGQQSFSLRAADGQIVSAPYTDESFRKLIESAEPVPTNIFRVTGIAEHGANERPLRFISVDSLDLLATLLFDEAYESAERELNAAFELEDGWIDGEAGTRVTDNAKTVARALLESMKDASIPAPAPYPTEAGGVQFEWSPSIYAVSLEISPTASAMHLQSTNTETISFEARDVPTDIPGQTLAFRWLIERIRAS